MSDFAEHIRQGFSKFCIRLSAEERGRMSLEVINSGRRMMETALRQQNPEWNEAELKVGVFKRMYQPDFTPEQLEIIAQSYLKDYSA
jgi:hypothetical protein